MVLESSARINASTKASTSSTVARRKLELSKVCSFDSEPQLKRRSVKEKKRRDRIMLRTVCTFRMVFNLCCKLEFWVQRGKEFKPNLG
jgi:hypothetical protein